MENLSSTIIDDKIKYVSCNKCCTSGVIISPFKAPKGWRRHFTIKNPRYIYYCKFCYETYVRGKPLFEEV